MNVYLTHHPSALNLYTIAVLKHWASLCGITLVEDEQKAEALWVSICDPSELSTIKRLRAKANGRPVIMGGFESYFGEPYLAWADYVVVGEGWEFVEAWAKDPNKAIALPCVLTKEKEATANYVLPAKHLPLLQMPGRNRFYFLAAKGCHQHCKFCATAWIMPHWENPLLNQLPNALVKYHRPTVNLITNDSSNVNLNLPMAGARSVRVRDYLREPRIYRANMVHFGVEGWTEEARRTMGKPLANTDIVSLFAATKWARQRCELFLIVDYPGWNQSDIESFLEAIPQDTAMSPSVHIKCTYFDPCPHTPWAREAITGQWIDTKALFHRLNSHNHRIRVFPTRSRARSAWRTCLHRSTVGEAMILGSEPSDINTERSWLLFLSALERKGLRHLVELQIDEPCQRIKVLSRWEDYTGQVAERADA